MDWLHIWMPIANVPIAWPGLVILGLGVGMISGFFGMGGGWMMTPGLNILGFPMAFAVGTGVTQMAGSSLVSARRHAHFGNVDYKLGMIMILGAICGFEPGAQIVMWLERQGKVDRYVQDGYVVLLSLIAWLVFTDLSRKKSKEREALTSGRAAASVSGGIEWHKTLHKIKVPPMIEFHKAGVRCSLWLPVAVSFLTGLMAGILGIGGGVICMPALIYLIGCPTHVAVGTDLFQVTVSVLYGAASYSYKGRTELLAAIIMLTGAAIGGQIGAIATKYVRGYGIRVFFGVAVVGCAVSIVLKLIPVGNPAFRAFLDDTAAILILGLVGALALYIFLQFLRGVRQERAARAAVAAV